MSRLLPLLMIVLLSGCISDATMWERVGVGAFDDALEDNPDGFLLDVRTQAANIKAWVETFKIESMNK